MLHDLEWLQMAADVSKHLPDQDLDWKWCRFGDRVVFAHQQHPPMIGGKDLPLQAIKFGETHAS